MYAVCSRIELGLADTNGLVTVACLQLDERVQCATEYKAAGFVRNSQQEQLVASAVIAAQHIPDSSVTLSAVPDQPSQVVSQSSSTTVYHVQVSTDSMSCSCPQGRLFYPCKHMMKVLGMITGKSGAAIILAMGTWAGTALGGLKQLQDSTAANSMARLAENFLLDGEESDAPSTGLTASAHGTALSNGATGSVASQQADHSMPREQIIELFHTVLDSADGNATLQQHLVSQVHKAQGTIEGVKARSSLGIAHPSLTQKQDGLKNSIVRLKSRVEAPHAKRPRPAHTSKPADAEAVPLAEPVHKAKKRSFKQQLAARADKENKSAASNSQPGQALAQEPAGLLQSASGQDAGTGAQTAAPQQQAAAQKKASNQKRPPRCGSCKARQNPKGKKGCESNKALKLLEQTSANPT